LKKENLLKWRDMAAMMEGYGVDMSRAMNDKKGSIYQLHPSSDVLDSLFEAIAIGVIFNNRDGVVTHMNAAAEEMLHIEKSDVIGKKPYMLPLRTPVYRVLSENCRDNPIDMTVMGRVYAVLASEVRNRRGDLLGEMTEIRDITAQRKEKRQGEEFVAMITHDLKSPVTVINGYVQMMKMGVYGPLGEKLENVTDQMEQSGERLLSMIEELLEVYQMEMGGINIKRERCDIVKIIKGCCRDNMKEARDKGIDLRFSMDNRMPMVNVDCKQLARVFNNLMGNAVKFTPRGGKISVRGRMSDGNLIVSVEDTGIGIPGEDLNKIFKKYFRSATVSGFKGTGLGLAICRAIVEAHGGAIEVESAEGKGSCFKVILEQSDDGD
jgi:PAS domain S-box-containing protein